MKIRRLVSVAAALAASATVAVAASADYTGGITFQSGTYAYRNCINQEAALKWDNDLGEPVEVDGVTFTNANITGDGTYTVSVDGLTDASWNMVKVETNIPSADYANATITLKEVIINGAVVDASAAEMSVYTTNSADCSADAVAHDIYKDCIRVQLINTYDGVAIIDNDVIESVEVTFEIAGMSADAADDTTTGGDTTTEAGKGSPDTGVEGIAVVAGAAIVAGGAMLLSKKRK